MGTDGAMGLTGLDMLVLLAVAMGAVTGLMRGFVGEAVALAAWLVAIMAVKALHTPVSLMLVGTVGTDTGAAVLAFALIFGIAFIAVRTGGRAVSRVTKASLLGPVDRLLGLGFGALKGLVIATMVFLFVGLILDMVQGAASPRPAWMMTSRSYPLLRASGDALVDFVARRRAA
jgi:membrane protein required for colicin V production